MQNKWENGKTGFVMQQIRETCIFNKEVSSIEFDYFFKEREALSIQFDLNHLGEIILLRFIFRYNVSKKELIIDYREILLDDTEIDTYETQRLPQEYYEKNNINREDMIKRADKLLFEEVFPWYFEKNAENDYTSKYNMDNLSDFEVIYHF